MKKAYTNNGLSFWTVQDDYEAQDGEVLFDDFATPDELTASFPGHAAAVAAADLNDRRAAIIAQLAALDTDMPRVFEDIITSGQCDLSKLPQAAQDRFHRKQTLRAELAAVA